MRKILTIAAREYKAMVGTKAFLISIIMMPVLMLGSIFVMELLRNSGEIKDRKIAVIDHTGSYLEAIQTAASNREQAIKNLDGGSEAESNLTQLAQDNYVIEVISTENVTDETRLALSDRIRDQDLYAFLEIPAGSGEDASSKIRFFAQDSSLSDAKG